MREANGPGAAGDRDPALQNCSQVEFYPTPRASGKPIAEFRAVTKKKPCAICGKPDWCRRSCDGCIECHRNTGEIPGFKLLKVTASGFGLYRRVDEQLPRAGRNSRQQRGSSSANARNGRGASIATPRNEIDVLCAFPSVEAFIRTLGDRHGGNWTDTTADGAIAFVVVRINESNGKKKFMPLHPLGNGWTFGDPPGLLPIYRLGEVISTPGTVFVFEGEKCVEAARSIGFLATTSAHGAKSPEKTDWTPLSGREAVILPDDDEPGWEYAESVASILTRLNPCARVKIVEVPT